MVVEKSNRVFREQTPLRMRIRELAMTRPWFGHQRIHVLLRREGLAISRKRVLPTRDIFSSEPQLRRA